LASLIFGLGYLGAALAARLLEEGHSVVGLDNGFATDWRVIERVGTSAAPREPGPAGSASSAPFRLLRGDIREAGDVERAFTLARPVEAVYLLAAQASAHPSAAPARYTEDSNLRGPRLVMEAALRHGSPSVVYGSSFHVYGPLQPGALAPPGAGQVLDEGRPYGLLRDLAHLSKVYAEKLGELFGATRGLAVAPVRLGIVYGLGPVVKHDPRFVTVPHAFCLRALAGEPLRIHPSGRHPLAFVHLDDAVQALRLAAPARGYAPANAAGELATALDVARLVQRAAWAHGHDAVVEHVDQQSLLDPGAQAGGPAGPPALPALSSRLSGAGWAPRRSLADTVPQIFEYYATRG
jgi:UDP-glucose 4-epimerase